MSASFVTGTIIFPGIDTPIRCTVARYNGTKPSPITIWGVPQAGTPDTSGAATFQFGSSSNLITMNNVLCDSGTLQVTTGGFVQIFQCFDRRWKWKLGTPLVGAYNVRDANGDRITSTEKTLAQLVTILLTACGEPSADVSLITSTEYPEVAYEYDNPADALGDLLGPRGYVVSLLADDSVKIFPAGVGTALPNNDDLVTASISIDPPEFPEFIRCVANRTMVQSMLKCVPVGLDTDGKIKLAKDLSYNPGGVGNATGWDGKDMLSFAYITDNLANQCAKESVGRWYQVDSQADGTQNLSFGDVDYIPGEITVTDASQYLPLKNFILETGANIYGKVQYKESFVSVTKWDPTTTNPPANVGPYYRLLETPFNLQEELGIVQFNDPQLKSVGGVLVFADVALTCCYSVRDNATYVNDHYTKDRSLGGIGVDCFKAQYIQRTLIAGYTAGTSTLNALTTNDTAVSDEADKVLDNLQQNYVTENANLLTYRDIYSFGTDGITLQIQWNVAVNGQVPIGTMASQYAETIPLLPTTVDLARARITSLTGSPVNRRNRRYLWEQFGKRAPGGGLP